MGWDVDGWIFGGVVVPRLTLLQTPVHAIPELRVVEVMEEFINMSSYSKGLT